MSTGDIKLFDIDNISLPSPFNTDFDDTNNNNNNYTSDDNEHNNETKQYDNELLYNNNIINSDSSLMNDISKHRIRQRPNLSLITPSRIPTTQSDLSPLSPFQTPTQLLNSMHTTNKSQYNNNYIQNIDRQYSNSSRQQPLSAGLLDDELSLKSPNSTIERQLSIKSNNNDNTIKSNIPVINYNDRQFVIPSTRSANDYDQSDVYNINDMNNLSIDNDDIQSHISDDNRPKFTYMRRSSNSTNNAPLNVPRSISTISRSAIKAPVNKSSQSRTSSKNQFSHTTTIDHTIELNKYKNEIQLLKDQLNAKDILLQSKVEQVTELTSQLLEYQQNYNNELIQSSDDEHAINNNDNNNNKQINKYVTLSVDQRTDYQNKLKQLDDHAIDELLQHMRDDMIDYTQKYHTAVEQRKLLHKHKQRYYIELSTIELDTDLKRHNISPSKRTSQFTTSLLYQKCYLQNLRSQYRTLQQHIRKLNRSIPQLENKLDQLHSVSSSNDKQHELLNSMHQLDTQKNQLTIYHNELIQIESQINEYDTAIVAQQQCINHSMDTRYNDYIMTQTEYNDMLQSYDEQQQLIEVTLEGLNETSYRLPYVQIEYLTRQYDNSQSQIQQLNNTITQLVQQNKQLNDTINQLQHNSVNSLKIVSPVTPNNNTFNITSTLDKKSITSPTSLRQRSASSLKVDTSVRNISFNIIQPTDNTNQIVQPLNNESVNQLSIQRSTSQSSSTSLLSHPYIPTDIISPLSPFTPHSVDPTNTPDIRYKEKMEQVEARIKSEMNKLMIKRQQLMSKLSPRSNTQQTNHSNTTIHNDTTNTTTTTTERRARIKRPSQSQPAFNDPLYNTTTSNDNQKINNIPLNNTTVTNLQNITDLSRRLASTSSQSSQPPSQPLTPSRKVGFGSPEPEN